MTKSTEQTASERYKKLEKKRTKHITVGDECASYTIPRFHSKFQFGNARFKPPMQAVGSYGVNNITSKLLLTLFPSNTLFFQNKANSAVIREADQAEHKAELERALQDRDLALLEYFESYGDRPKLYQLLKRLAITGNCLVYVPKHEEGSIQIFALSQYVVVRDGSGNLLELIVQEKISPLMLQEDQVGAELKESLTRKYDSDNKDVELYTHVIFDGSMYKTYQEIQGKKIPKSEGTYAKDKLPWHALRLTSNDGDDYGGGFVEDYLGDLKSLEVLTRAITGGAAASARLLIFVSPEGHTNIDDVTDTENGGVLHGRAEDVTILQLDKRADYQTAEKMMITLEERLKTVFLLNSAVQRQAERVTAEEIKYVARELEDGLGGLYSVLSYELQLPYVASREFRLIQANLIDPLPEEVVQPTIITGFDALGRGNDKMKIINYIRSALETVGPEKVQARINEEELLTRLAVADGIEIEGLWKSDEELAALQAQQQEQALAPELLKQAGGIAQKAINQ